MLAIKYKVFFQKLNRQTSGISEHSRTYRAWSEEDALRKFERAMHKKAMSSDHRYNIETYVIAMDTAYAVKVSSASEWTEVK